MTSEAKGFPLILLAGPTAVGKTALSLKMAELLGTEIINADSMQVYRHMDVGTAKPSREERRRIRHHLLDVVSPHEPFDASRYLELARPVIDALHAQAKVPLVVGGTGLYMKVLTRSLCAAAPGDPAIRLKLAAEVEELGPAALHEDLNRVDPELGRRIHPHDRQRILRALEVYRATGVPLSEWQARHGFEQTLYPSIKVFLHRPRIELYERINRRVEHMIEQGLQEEVQGLLQAGYGPQLKPMQSLGYKEMVEVLLGQATLEEAVHKIQKQTRRYAKRQETWFRADPEFRWFHAEDEEGVVRWVRHRLVLLCPGQG